jgi:hypothetical protein
MKKYLLFDVSLDFQQKLDGQWMQCAPQISVVLSSGEISLPEEDRPCPFDATLEKPIDDQKYVSSN